MNNDPAARRIADKPVYFDRSARHNATKNDDLSKATCLFRQVPVSEEETAKILAVS